MYIAIAHLESISPISFSYYLPEKPPKKSWDVWEKEAWRERCHTTEDGNLFIPPMAFKRSLENAAKYKKMKIKGEGRATYGNVFTAGTIVQDGLVLPEKKDTVEGEGLWCSSEGKKGGAGGSMVYRIFPIIKKWEGSVEYHILDERISQEVLEDHLKAAGVYVGLLRWRPQNGGLYGRYVVKSVKYKQVD